VKALPPTETLLGESVVMVGTGSLTVKLAAPEVPPPGFGLVTVMLTVAALTRSLAGTCAVILVALENVVVSAAPFQLTTEPLTKLVPFTVNVNEAEPAVALAGESELIVGNPVPMENVLVPDVPPPGVGLVTVTFAVPELAISLAGTAAVICVAVTNVVVSAAPFHFTTELARKPLPLTVSVNAAPPADALVGSSEAITGAGLLMG
jgi:hypothetical protein